MVSDLRGWIERKKNDKKGTSFILHARGGIALDHPENCPQLVLTKKIFYYFTRVIETALFLHIQCLWKHCFRFLFYILSLPFEYYLEILSHRDVAINMIAIRQISDLDNLVVKYRAWIRYLFKIINACTRTCTGLHMYSAMNVAFYNVWCKLIG